MTYHKSVLLKETIDFLNPKKEGFFVDATGGGGGHAKEILKRIVPGGKLVIIDCDHQAIEEAQKQLKEFEGHTIFVEDNFANIKTILSSINAPLINGIIFDLGVSSHQIDAADRGFSFMVSGPLDMRMDKKQPLTACDIINNCSRDELIKMLSEYGEEHFSKRVCRSIMESRPLHTTKEFMEAIKKAVPPKFHCDSVVRCFQAIRIAVNSELENLKTALPDAIKTLEKGGRIAVLSYHSLEDRIVKQIFKVESTDCICDKKLPVCICSHKKLIKLITKKPVTASEEEKKKNPRSRSAKLRVAERI
jgi:16S rRNA (cytosine1402-N4)-methyltransferase